MGGTTEFRIFGILSQRRFCFVKTVVRPKKHPQPTPSASPLRRQLDRLPQCALRFRTFFITHPQVIAKATPGKSVGGLLQIWPRRAYEQDVVVNSGFGRKRFLLNSPKAIHRVLVENASNYARTPATIRILGPITGNGLLLSEGEEWRHQRRTIAPALAPRVMPMLAPTYCRRGAGGDRSARWVRRGWRARGPAFGNAAAGA
jgi:hypothetical protein